MDIECNEEQMEEPLLIEGTRSDQRYQYTSSNNHTIKKKSFILNTSKKRKKNESPTKVQHEESDVPKKKIVHKISSQKLKSPVKKSKEISRRQMNRKEYMQTKMKYYRRLEQDWVNIGIPNPQPSSTYRLDLAPPPHILPSEVYVPSLRRNSSKLPRIKQKQYYQSSLSTIFSIWNTMIGSTLVTLPYGFSTSGLLLGIGIVFLIGSICCYTCSLIIFYGEEFPDFGDLVQYHYGRPMQLLSMTFSVFVLIGACIAYHILMQECLYKGMIAILNWSLSDPTSFLHHWNPKLSAVLILFIYPLTNLKNVSALISLNSLGIPFVLYSIYFIVFHGLRSIIKMDESFDFIVYDGKKNFGQLGGILTLSFFIHNAIQPITKNCDPKTNRRDVIIAYLLVGLSYTLVGALGYFGFADSAEQLIQQNFLDAFPNQNLFAFTARISLFFQLATVYPIVLLIIRTQVFGLLQGTSWPNVYAVMLLNFMVMFISTMFAMFYPKVGDILRFTGSFGGLVMIYLLPVGIHLLTLHKKQQLTFSSMLIHGFIILIGTIFLLLQFIKF